MSDLDLQPLAVQGGEESGHEVQPKERQVGEVVAGELLPPEVGMNEAQPPEQLAPQGEIGEFRDENAPLVPHDDVLHGAGATDECPHLASGFLGELGHPPCQFVADDLLHRDTAAVESLQPVDLALLESGQIAVKLLNKNSPEIWLKVEG